MKGRRVQIFRQVDWPIILIYLALALIGWINIYAASFNEEYSSIFSFSQNYGKQFIWILTSLFLGWLVLMTDGRFFEKFAYPIFIFILLLLGGVLIFGTEIKGAQSWYKIGSFSLQPSEFGKFATSLAVAKLLTSNDSKAKEFFTTLKALVIIALPAILILLQPDTGSTLVYAAFIFVLYREGLSGKILLGGLLLIVLFVLALLFELDQLVIVFTILGWALYNSMFSNRKMFILSTLVLSVFVTAYLLLPYPDYYLLIAIESAALLLFLVNAFNREIKDRWERNGVLSMFIIALGFIFTVGFIFTNVLQEHQRTRITVLLGEEDELKEQIIELQEKVKSLPLGSPERTQTKEDLRSKKESLDKLKRGAGWNVNQSKIAIGSGGLFGKGFLDGTQTKFDFVPEQSTDFIFCTVGEEWGFIGSTIVVLLFVALLVRLIIVAERQRSRFTRIYGYSVASIFFFHFAINIAMTLGLAPVIGIPLPFLSYGGSSLWAFSILLFIFLKLDSQRMAVLR